MANNYTLMSCALVVETPEQKKWLEKYIPIIECSEDLVRIDDDDGKDEYPLLQELKREAEELGMQYLWDDIWESFYQDLSGPELSFRKDGEGPEYLWVRSEESVPSFEGFVALIRIFLMKFDIDKAFTMQWAETCDKPILGEFGGGAVVVSKENTKWMSTGRWVEDVLNGNG